MLTPYLISGLAKLIRAMPQGLCVTFGRASGWMMRCVFRFRVDVVRRQMAASFGAEKSEKEIQQLIKALYRHYGLLLLELLSFPNYPRSRALRLTELAGEEHLQDALAAGKGVLLLTAHLGNWEIGGIGLAARGYRLQAIGKEMKNPVGEQLRRMLRDGNGVKTIPRRNSIKQIFRALQDQQVVVVLMDQNMTVDEGIFVDFFGRPACTMKALAVLAARTKAPVVPVIVSRQADLRHHEIRFEAAIPYESVSDDKEENYHHNTQRYTRKLEEMVRTHPDQWMWIHKRWRTQPEASDTAAGSG